jgi:ligand-binding SRPBCC domain-containing protein
MNCTFFGGQLAAKKIDNSRKYTMPVFNTSFIVSAPLQAVAEFHYGTQALKQLTPPPVFVSLKSIEPMAEGSRSEFTMWFGPFPVHWIAIHSQVDPLHGFTDTQQTGPLASWRHTHQFETYGAYTRVNEHIEYAYPAGLPGLWARLLFNSIALRFMFAYRAWNTRRLVNSR